MTIQEIMALKSMCRFLNGLIPKKVFVIITHCDVQIPSEQNLDERIQLYAQYSGLKIPRENVLKFGNDKKHLLPLFNSKQSLALSSAPMTLVSNLSAAAHAVKSELPSLVHAVSKSDKIEGEKLR